MINKHYISSLIPAALLGFFLVGCSGESRNNFIDPDAARLVAHPQVFVLKQGETQRVDLTQSVVAKNVASWKIADLDDKTGLGTILNPQATYFDYQATQSGAGSFNYTVKGDNLTATSQIVLAVNAGETPGNNIPVADNITLSTFNNVDAIIDLSAYITDADGDTLRINKLVSASNRFTLNGFQVTFAPDGFVGVDQAVYSVDDGRGGYALAYIVVTSNDANPPAPNTAPVAKDDSLSMDVAKQSVLNINLSGLISDADGDSLKVVTLYSHNDRAVLKENASVDYTPGNFRGVDQFTYLVSDGKGGYDLGTVTVTVGDSTPPTPPTPSLVAYQQAFVLDVDQLQTIDVTQSVTSEHLDAWSLTTVQDSTNLGVVSAKTATTFNYLAQTPGVAQIDYSVQGGSLSANSTITVAINAPVTPDNHRPEAQDTQLETLNNASKTIDLQGKISDVDGDTLSITLHGSARFSLNGTQVTFTPNGFVGLDQAVYSVEDGKGGYALANIVAISEDANPPVPNMAPTANDAQFTLDVAKNVTFNIDLVAQRLIADADGDALSIAHIYTANNRATKQGATGITYTPGAFRGVDQFTYVITDGKDGYAINAITVVVNDSTPANKIPTAGPVTAKMLHNDPAITISVNSAVSDADGDTLKIVSISGALGQASINPANALEMLYEPKGFVGTDRFVYVVSDDNGGYAMGEVTVTVTDSNPTAPVANTVQENTLLDTPINIDLSAYISDKETETANLVISNVTNATSPAVATLSGQTVIYTPNGFTGNDILTYTVTDGRHSTNGTIVISVNAHGAHAIQADNLEGGTEPNAPFIHDLSALISTTDPTAGELIVVNAIGGALGTATVTNNILTYTPKLGVFGKDRLIYTVKDSHNPAHYTQGTISITIFAPAKPEITKLEAKKETDGYLKAYVTCRTCDVTQYKYAWIINGLTKSTGETYIPTAADDGFNIRLEVTGQDAYGQVTEMQYVVYAFSKVETIFSAKYTFAALKTDGSVVTWGYSDYGGDSSSVAGQLTSGVKVIYSNSSAFAAVKEDGSVVTWGSYYDGGDSSSVAGQLTSGVKVIYSTGSAFAAVKEDGSVVTWGSYGGNSSSVAGQLTSGVKVIYSTDNVFGAFAAVKEDGSVVTWGGSSYGGDSSSVAGQLTSGVKVIYSNSGAFAAVKEDGSVVTWGNSGAGGDSSRVAGQLTSGVKVIDSTNNAFAAVKEDGSVVTWGNSGAGGDSSSVAGQLTSGVKVIYSTNNAFAAVKEDGSVVTWGDSGAGGDSSSVAGQLTSGVKVIYSTGSAFAAVKQDGSVVTWGDSGYGGDSSSVAGQLTSGVKVIDSTNNAFAAVKEDDSVVTWGSSGNGGDSSSVAGQLTSGVKVIDSTSSAFAVVKEDGSVVTWGRSFYGGDSSSVADKLAPNLFLIETSIN
ncbi:tandem-95 repeat protein [Shewanella oneidensis]|uniref:Ig-like domain-containing protein n=2 Tax=Shewanella oneidensis TaxID=70863 RepID=UPI0029C5025A|nr:tandem-95 repeat protein [Shewanella oneidensis]MDX5999718.1 tandem-95 repeat protein [Shewanella oneidensis]